MWHFIVTFCCPLNDLKFICLRHCVMLITVWAAHLLPQCWDWKKAPPHHVILCGVWKWNAGPHACMARIVIDYTITPPPFLILKSSKVTSHNFTIYNEYIYHVKTSWSPMLLLSCLASVDCWETKFYMQILWQQAHQCLYLLHSRIYCIWRLTFQDGSLLLVGLWWGPSGHITIWWKGYCSASVWGRKGGDEVGKEARRGMENIAWRDVRQGSRRTRSI